MPKKTHKGQHYVPESYLKAWCDPACPQKYERYVWLFDRDGRNPRNRAPKNIFKETDFYTIEKADGIRDLRLEHGLSGLETKFSKIRKHKLALERPMTEEEHAYLAVFVAAAQFRTRASRDHHAGQWTQVLEIGEDVERALKDATPEQRRAFCGMSRSSSTDVSLSMDQVRKLSRTPIQVMIPSILRAVTPQLVKMNMLIFCREDPVGFVTSDRPVTWYDPEAYKLPPMFRSPALGSLTIEVSMPLSPRQCVVFARGAPTGYAPATEFVVNELNRRHIAHCGDHFVVCSNQTKEYWFEEFEPPDDAWEKRQPKPDNL